MTRDARFYLDTDNDLHWYVIPLECKPDWELFLDIPEDDERSWDPPDWAVAVGGSPSRVTFSEPSF